LILAVGIHQVNRQAGDPTLSVDLCGPLCLCGETVL
jgi:hypothetical protein